MAITDLYWTTADLYASVRSSRDSIGGEVRTASLLEANIPCYITALSAREVADYGKMERSVSHRMFCDCRDVSTADLVLWKSQWYDVVFPEDASSGLHHHLEILLSLTDAPLVVSDESSSSESSESSSSSTS